MFFFFKPKTSYEMRISDWSSDVCSSYLSAIFAERALRQRERLIARAREILRTQWPVLEEWLRARDFAVVPPAAGAIAFARGDLGQIGRASCRDRVCQHV